ncbi:nuclease domain-containing protein [uncultured Pseudomonas sp.]|uniref:nuclease domain-containing protein n=1 Tax=uncultured Pseudomonas sp. TaxID=114707 RepID=UPI0025ED3735|nr:nuclease domain-containing protein [uncultured Pseudomonas sp.]
MSRVQSKKLRDSARGQDCTLRIPGICNGNPETTVLAHIACGQKGMGLKSPDNMAVFACSCCHDLLDGRRRGELDQRDVIRALGETQAIWISQGLMTIKGAA